MKKGKSRTRRARFDIMKNNARQAARLERKARATQTRQQRPGKAAYEKHRYDGTDASEEEAT